MILKNSLRIALIIVIIVLNISCDQISKEIVRKSVKEYENIPLINGYFTLTRIENSGAFLSLGDTLPDLLRFILLTFIPILVLAGGLVFLFLKKELSQLLVIGFSFVIGGGIGNLYDRILYGSVTDFFHMNFVIFQTGIFNMADVSIMVGMGLVILESLLKKKTATDNA